MRTDKHGPVTGGAAPAAIAEMGDGVTRWTVTRLGLIEAMGEVPGSLFDAVTCPGCDPGSAEADLADAILAALPADGQSSTRAEAPASDLLALAADLDRRADRIGGHGLTRDGTIRARVLREAAGMARRRAQGGQESAYGSGARSADIPGVSAGLTDALTAAPDDDADLYEDGWPL